MALSTSEIAHRWAHNMLGKSKSLNGCSCHCTEMNFYSYSTVIAQALDRNKNLFLVIDENLTSTTGRHLRSVELAIPGEWNVIRTHWNDYNRYDNVHFLDGKFDREQRMRLISHLLLDLYHQFEKVLTGKKESTKRISLMPLVYIFMLDNIYHDCSLSQWLKARKSTIGMEVYKYEKEVRIMASLLVDMKFHNISEHGYYGIVCDTEGWDKTIADALFGNGTWDAMLNRLSGIDKAKATLKRLDAIREYLGLETIGGFHMRPSQMPNKEIRNKLKTAEGRRELLEMKKRIALEDAQGNETGMRKIRVKQACERARKFLGIENDRWHDSDVKLVKNGEDVVYDDRCDNRLAKEFGYNERMYFAWRYFNDEEIHFCVGSDLYKQFCEAPDKKRFKELFYKICELKMRRKRGRVLYQILKEKPDFQITEDGAHMLNEYVLRKEKYEAKERAAEIEHEEQRKREERIKLEKIEAYKNEGMEGLRRIWHERLGSIPADVYAGSDFYFGGNVLLRFSQNGNYIETSKHIQINFSDAHKYWEIIKKWHDTGKFKSVSMAGYKVESFDNNILKAGCHAIAYEEMEWMYNELCKKETA